MAQVELPSPDLATLSRTYGTVHKTKIGEVAYTKIVSPKGFVLQAKDEQLRYYLYKKPDGVWEHVWGVSSIVHEGLPIGEGLMQYKVKQGFKAGLQALDDPEKFAAQILQEAADVGSHVHAAAEELLLNKEVVIAGRPKREMWPLISLANFINDFKIKNAQTEQVLAYDRVHDGVRIVCAGTTDLICDIYNEKEEKWETWLIDYKTSKDAHLSHKVQIRGYGGAAEMSLGIKIDRYGVLLLGKATIKGYSLVEVGREKKQPITFETFILAYKMALVVNNGSLPGPTYKVFPTTIKLKEAIQNDLGNSNNSSDSPSGAVRVPKAGRTEPVAVK